MFVLIVGLSGSMEHLFGNTPAYQVVKTVKLHAQFHTAFMTNGLAKFVLIVGRYLGQNIGIRTPGTSTHGFQVFLGRSEIILLTSSFGSHQYDIGITNQTNVHPITSLRVLRTQGGIGISLLVEMIRGLRRS